MTQIEAKFLTLGNQSLPLDIHHLGLAEVDGPPSHSFGFAFTWQQFRFAVRYQDNQGQEPQGQAYMDLSADLCPLPFSSESPQARIDLKAIMDAANQMLGPVIQLNKGQLRLNARLKVQPPVTAVGMVTPLTGFLIRLRPYLDCLGVIVCPPLESKPGQTRLRPHYRKVVKLSGAPTKGRG